VAIARFSDHFIGDNEALPMKTEPKSAYQLSAERRKAKTVLAPEQNVIPCDQRGMCVSHEKAWMQPHPRISGFGRIRAACRFMASCLRNLWPGKNRNFLQL
jgi:hypothetical protein